tara:strand:+ start:1098 stop:1292 length:195 start_codon:yes stop_codon:yes gene_type:complete
MADGLNPLDDVEIKLECLRLAVEFAPESIRLDPLKKASIYYDWVHSKKNSTRQSKKTSFNKDKV